MRKLPEGVNVYTLSSIPGHRKIQIILTREEQPEAIPNSFDLDFLRGYCTQEVLHLNVPLMIALVDSEIYLTTQNIYVHQLLKVLRYPCFELGIDSIIETICQIANDNTVLFAMRKGELRFRNRVPGQSLYPIVKVTLLDLRANLQRKLTEENQSLCLIPKNVPLSPR